MIGAVGAQGMAFEFGAFRRKVNPKRKGESMCKAPEVVTKRSANWRRQIPLILALCLSMGTITCHRGDKTDVEVEKKALETTTNVLSGTIFGGGSTLPATLVEALVDGTTTVIASNLTNPSGAYAMDLAEATYDLRVTPPVGSGYEQQTVQNIVMAGADKRNDIVLIAPGGGVAGHVRGYGGVGVAGVTVNVFDSAARTLIGSATTDELGAYQLSLGTGNYYFEVRPPSPSPAGTPNGYWYVTLYNQAISGATTVDLDLLVAKIQGTVTDPSGDAVENVTVAGSGDENTPSRYTYYSSAKVQTDSLGHYELLIFTGPNNSFVVTPTLPLDILVQNRVIITGDTNRNFVLSDSAGVTGHVRGYGGVGVAGVTVNVFDTATWTVIGSATTDELGAYQLSLGTGNYYFEVRPPSPSPAGTPNGYWYITLYNQAISGATTVDLDLPVVKIRGTVTDPSGDAVENVTVAGSGDENTPLRYTYYSSAKVQTDSLGHYELLVFTGPNNTFVVTPTLPLGILVQNGVIITEDTTLNFILSDAAGVTGHVRGYEGVGVAGVTVNVFDTATRILISSATTDEHGAFYQLSLGTGNYYFEVRPPSPSPTGTPNGYWYETLYNQAISGTTTVDLDLPVAKIQGTVTDSNGAPVPNVTVAGSGEENTPSRYTYYSSATVQTNSQGHYELLVFTGPNNSFVVTPPSGSGFTITALENVSIADDFWQNIILVRSDLLPPVIVSGPGVVHLSDTSASIRWQTNEPADSRVDFGKDGLVAAESSTSMLTTHEVTLVGLTPSTVYQYQVSSTDVAGNGPTKSAILTFQTDVPPGDITPPVIIAGPTVTSIGQTTALVSWTTDEPASSILQYGTTPGLSTSLGITDKFTVNHQIALSGLAPNTLYYFTVSSIDPDENGPTTSASSSFTTLAMSTPQNPPVITPIPDMVVEATNAVGSIVTFSVTANDVEDGPLTATCVPASGVTFPIALTTVACTATDSDGATASATFTVSVVDTTSPVFTFVPPSSTVSNCSSANIGLATADDAVGPVTVTNNAPTVFSDGPTIVTWTAKDGAGNITTATQTVTGACLTCIFAGQDLYVKDRGRINGTSVGAANLYLGVSAKVAGDAKASGNVDMRNNSAVTGTLRVAGNLTRGASTTIGTLIKPATVTLPTLTTKTFTVKRGSVSVAPGATKKLLPGNYGDMTIYGRAKVTLAAGTYNFASLNIESQAKLTLDTSAGPITVNVQGALVFKSQITWAATSPNSVIWYSNGNIDVEPQQLPAFPGDMVAPNGAVRIASQNIINGCIAGGKSVSIEPDDIINGHGI